VLCVSSRTLTCSCEVVFHNFSRMLQYGDSRNLPHTHTHRKLICNYSTACHWQAFGIIRSQTRIFLNFLVTHLWNFERWGGVECLWQGSRAFLEFLATQQWSYLRVITGNFLEFGKFVVDSDWNMLSFGSGKLSDSTAEMFKICVDVTVASS